MADRAISGKEGYAMVGSCDVYELASWNAVYDQSIHTYNSRSGAGWQKTVRGNNKVSGTIETKWMSGIKSVFAKDTLVAVELHNDDGDYLSGNARLGPLTYNANLDTGEPQTVSVPFESDGAWTITEA